MKRKYLWATGIIAVAATTFFSLAPSIVENSMNKVVGTSHKVSSRATALHRDLTIVDLHSDALLWKRALTDYNKRGHVDLPRLQQGNVALQIFSAVTKTPRGLNYGHNDASSDSITALSIAQLQPIRTWTSLTQRALYQADKLKTAADGSHDRLRVIRSRADLEKLIADRKKPDCCKDEMPPGGGKPSYYKPIGGLLAIEGLHAIEGKMSNFQWLDFAGYRIMGLTHFFDNEVADSMHGVRQGGLTPFGREVVKAMEKRGIIVDVAHLSHKGVAEVLAMATKPVISSHGGVQGTCKGNRNLTDEEVKGIAKTGGVVGIGYWPDAVCSTDPAAIAKAILHVRDIAGIDHVALGSDFDGAVTTPFDTSGVAHVTQALIEAGLSDADIAKVMGGNVVRVLMQVLPL